jgi:geranylgeranyl diphosphate synthase, type II
MTPLTSYKKQKNNEGFTNETVVELQYLFENKLSDFLKEINKTPENLYQPLEYILNLGGKRIRPLLLLLSTHLFDKNKLENSLNSALAIEIFHNFSLVHDDIMDKAPLRRGKATVHKKWNENIGILSGDVMMVKAFELLLNYEPVISHRLYKEFTKVAVEVCEGQQLDMDFESQTEVTVDEYINMIKLKTAVLLASALKMGGIIADASQEDLDNLYSFGLNAGLGFQLQDDYLDAFGDANKVGKQVGGDIIANKKTFLTLKSFELGNKKQKEILSNLFFEESKVSEEEKVNKVLEIYTELGIDKLSEILIDDYYQKAYKALQKINSDESSKAPLKFILELLSERKY